MYKLIPTDELQIYRDIFYQNVVTKEYCDELLEDTFNNKEYFVDGTVNNSKGDYVNNDLKITTELILDEHIDDSKIHNLYVKYSEPVVKFVHNIIQSCHPSMSFLKGMKLYNGNFRFKHYPKGIGKYDWHLDTGGDYSKRVMTVLLYLSDVEEGGEVEFSAQDCQMKSTAGSMIAFPPYWNYPHRSVPNKSHDKNILAVFIEKL